MLNVKEKLFATAYIKNKGNAYKAALEAGYAEKTAKTAYEWLNNKNVEKRGLKSKYKPELKEYIDEQLEKIHDENTADAKEVMEYLTSVMRGETEAEIVVVEGEGEGFSRARRMMKAPDEKERLKAADTLAKILGISNNININTAIPVVIAGEDELED